LLRQHAGASGTRFDEGFKEEAQIVVVADCPWAVTDAGGTQGSDQSRGLILSQIGNYNYAVRSQIPISL
jgi:hypothetical protein